MENWKFFNNHDVKVDSIKTRKNPIEIHHVQTEWLRWMDITGNDCWNDCFGLQMESISNQPPASAFDVWEPPLCHIPRMTYAPNGNGDGD